MAASGARAVAVATATWREFVSMSPRWSSGWHSSSAEGSNLRLNPWVETGGRRVHPPGDDARGPDAYRSQGETSGPPPLRALQLAAQHLRLRRAVVHRP